jgi:DNA-binding transcriptional ArsR family regulator
MTLFTLQDRDGLMAVRFATSPVWETQAAVQVLADERARIYHASWLAEVRADVSELGLAPLVAVLPRHGYAPDFLVPPPPSARAGIAEQLAQVRGADPAQVARELRWCHQTVHGKARRLLARLLTDPERARDHLAARLDDAWTRLVAPFWMRIEALLQRDIDQRARTLARDGLRHVLGHLHPKLRWTTRGLWLADGSGRTVEVDQRGLLLMPSAYLWPHLAAIVEPPWLPTIIYPAAGIGGLWQSPAPALDALGRLLGQTRALILAYLDQPLSTTALAARLRLSMAGVSAHLVTLRDAGLLAASRHGHEVRYHRTDLGSALLSAYQEAAELG